MLLINLAVALIVVLIFQKLKMRSAIIKQLGLLELTWICILLMTGLFYTFGTLESKNSNQSFAEAAGVETMQTFYMLGVFLIVHLAIVGAIVRQVFANRK